MSPVRLWFGLVFLAMGVLAIFDATGAVEWSSAVDGWWPLVITGWGVAEMVAQRKVGLGAVAVALIGLALLAEAQAWAGETVIWSVLFLLIGAAILGLGRFARKDRPANAAQVTES
jgi:hypothetical protein